MLTTTATMPATTTVDTLVRIASSIWLQVIVHIPTEFPIANVTAISGVGSNIMSDCSQSINLQIGWQSGRMPHSSSASRFLSQLVLEELAVLHDDLEMFTLPLQ